MKQVLTILIPLIMVGAIVAFIFMNQHEPILVGYVSGTTGTLSETGVDGRNAFLLRINEANDAGGIDGRMIETMVLNDENDPEKVAEVHDTFEAAGVHFIIGHIISGLDMAVLKEAQSEDKLIMSASMSSANMDGIDDQFIRIAGSYAGQVEHLSKYMYETDGIASVSVIYDLRNQAYAEGFYLKLIEMFPGSVISGYAITGEPGEADGIVKAISQDAPDAVLMITPAVETAKYCQMMDVSGLEMDKYSVSWSMTNDLFTNGGNSVDGLKIVYVPYEDSYQQNYDAFVDRFVEAYGYEPSSICFNTYEITSMFVEALNEVDQIQVDTVKDAMIHMTYDGLSAQIYMDEFGDRVQHYTIYEVMDGTFVDIEQ